jgi:rhomboid protease GluP
MRSFVIKLKLIFLPLVIITVCSIISYTFLHWLLLIRFHLFRIDNIYIEFVGPLVLVGIPILIWLRPRIKLLNLNAKGNRDPLGFLLVVAWAAVGVPVIIAQSYIVKASGKLTRLDNASSIAKLPTTKYYTIKNLFADKANARVKSDFAVSGKHSEDFNMTIYVAIPVFDKNNDQIFDKNIFATTNKNILVIIDGKPISKESLSAVKPDIVQSISILKGAAAKALYGDKAKHGVLLVETKKFHEATKQFLNTPPKNTGQVAPAFWLGINYKKTIDNDLSQAEKENNYKDFAQESQTDFNIRQLTDFVYLDRIEYDNEMKGYLSAIATDERVIDADSAIVLVPKKEAFEKRNGNALAWIFGSFGIAGGIFLITIQFFSLRKTERISKTNIKRSLTGLKDLKDVLWPRPGYAATPIIIDLNFIVFITMVCSGLGFISFTTHDLLQWGGNYGPDVKNGQYWRLLSAMFLHGGIMHVLFNMYGLLFAGIFLEPVLGTLKFALLYLFTGIVASITSIWWHPDIVSVGASGAIFGIYGVFLALLTTNIFPAQLKKSFLITTSIFVGYNLLMGIRGNTDNAAHIGGLITGIIAGYSIYPLLRNKIRLENEEQDKIVEDDINDA